MGETIEGPECVDWLGPNPTAGLNPNPGGPTDPSCAFSSNGLLEIGAIWSASKLIFRWAPIGCVGGWTGAGGTGEKLALFTGTSL